MNSYVSGAAGETTDLTRSELARMECAAAGNTAGNRGGAQLVTGAL